MAQPDSPSAKVSEIAISSGFCIGFLLFIGGLGLGVLLFLSLMVGKGFCLERSKRLGLIPLHGRYLCLHDVRFGVMAGVEASRGHSDQQ